MDYALVNIIHKILIIQTAFAGDVILTTPLVRAAKVGFPNAEVHFLTIPATANVLENNPHLTRIWLYDKRKADSGMRRFLFLTNRLKRQKFDLALVPHRSLRSALLSFASGASLRIGFDTSAGSFLFTQKVKYEKDLHEIDRNLALIDTFAIRLEDHYPEVFPDRRDVAIVDQLLAQVSSRSSELVAIAPSSVWSTKCWPKESYTQLCRLFSNENNLVVLIGGLDDKKLGDEITNAAGTSVVNVAGRLTLRQSAELLRRCRVLVTNDSAPMHLAAAVGTPAVAIFGPTIPEFGFYPYRSNSRVVEKTMSCRPCGIHGGKKCPIGTHECMIGISPNEVMETATEVFAMR